MSCKLVVDIEKDLLRQREANQSSLLARWSVDISALLVNRSQPHHMLILYNATPIFCHLSCAEYVHGASCVAPRTSTQSPKAAG